MGASADYILCYRLGKKVLAEAISRDHTIVTRIVHVLFEGLKMTRKS